MLHEFVRAADVLELTEADLRDDGAELAAGGGDTVRGRAVAGGENFPRDNEGGGVGAEVLEEIGEAVEEDEGFGVARSRGQLVVSEA